MKRDEVFPSKYLKASDLNGKPVVVTIRDAQFEVLKNPKGEEQSKTVLYFASKKKSLPLNVVNWDSVADILGGDTEDWIGGKIELYPTKTEMAGKPCDCIRRPRAERRLAAEEDSAAGRGAAAAVRRRRPRRDPVLDLGPRP
jgi:hypothetical protein